MNDERTESPESLEQAMERMQPDPVHYHFAYSVLPSKLFQGRAAAVLLLQYWRGLEKYFRNLWQMMAEQVNPESSRLAQLLSVTAHRIGGKHVVLLVKMPPATRVLETHFVALVFRPELRFFTLGNSPALIRGEGPETTFREVTSDGANCNLGMGPEPTAKALLLHICRYLDVEPTVEEMSESEVHKFANRVPPCGPSVFDSAAGLNILQGFVSKTEREQRTVGVSAKLASLFAQLGSRNSSGPPQQITPRDLPLEEIDVILGCLFSDWAGAKKENGEGAKTADSRSSSATAHPPADEDQLVTGASDLDAFRKSLRSSMGSAFDDRPGSIRSRKFTLIRQMCVSLVLVSVGVFGVLSLHSQFVAGSNSRNWPKARGVMKIAYTDSKTEHIPRRGRRTYHSPVVRYEYTVDGKSYVGDRYSYSPRRSQDFNSVQRLVFGLLPGTEVDVFYDPENAAESVLVRGSGSSTRSLYFLAYLTAFLALGWLVVCTLRFRKLTS